MGSVAPGGRAPQARSLPPPVYNPFKNAPATLIQPARLVTTGRPFSGNNVPPIQARTALVPPVRPLPKPTHPSASGNRSIQRRVAFASAPYVIQRMQSEVDVEMDVQEDGPSLARIPFERFLELVVEMVKSNVKTLAGKVRDNAAEIDRVAAQLTPASGPSAANCAAVYRDDHDLVAWNTNLLTKARDYYGCNAGPGAGVWDYVTDNTLGKHAEMKILDDQAFNEMTGGNFSGVYIGISKPCCLPCAAVMAIAGISTRGRHADKNTNWAFPRYILDSEDRWKRFLGAKATEALAERGLSSTQRSMFRGRLVQQL